MLSRVADNLYWMSRYLERAENTARIIDVYLNFILDLPPGIQAREQQATLLHSLSINVDEAEHDDFQELIRQLTFERDYAHSIIASISSARENARQVREQISSEMWLQINRLYLSLKKDDKGKLWRVEPHDFYMGIKLDIHLFQGITDSTIVHNQGWHFIQIGRSLERVINLMSVLNVYMQLSKNNNNGHQSVYTAEYFEMLTLLKSLTAWEAYCKVYSPDLNPDHVLEFLLFNDEFPHSAHYCVNAILDSVHALGEATMLHKNSRLYRLVGRLQSNLSYDDLEEVLESDFTTYLSQVRKQVLLIHEALFATYITYSIDSALK